MPGANSHAEYCWAELAAPEVASLLRQTARGQDGGALSGFLDTHQWSPLRAKAGVTLAGGHPAAQFRRAGLDVAEVPLCLWRLDPGQLAAEAHTAKQLRAWLYRTGAPASSLGDIVTGAHVMLAATGEMDFAAAGLAAEESAGWDPPPVKPKRTTAASARADAVVAAVFHVSRGEAQTAIEYQFLFRDFAPLSKRTALLKAGHQLVYRTKGRAELCDLELNPRSGRVWVEYRLFPA